MATRVLPGQQPVITIEQGLQDPVANHESLLSFFGVFFPKSTTRSNGSGHSIWDTRYPQIAHRPCSQVRLQKARVNIGFNKLIGPCNQVQTTLEVLFLDIAALLNAALKQTASKACIVRGNRREAKNLLSFLLSNEWGT